MSETKDFRDAFSLWRTGTKRATVTWSREGERTKKSTERDARATGAQITRKSKTRLSLWSAVVPRPRWLDGDTSGVAECVLATVVLTASGGRPDAGTVLGSREKRETLHTDDNIVTPIARPRTGGSSSEGYAFVNRCCTPARHPPACTGAYRKQSSLSNTIPPRFWRPDSTSKLPQTRRIGTTILTSSSFFYPTVSSRTRGVVHAAWYSKQR